MYAPYTMDGASGTHSRVVVPFPGSSLHKYIVATDPLDGEVHDVNLGAVCLCFLEVFSDQGPIPLLRLGMASTVWHFWVKDAMRNILLGELNHSLDLGLPPVVRLRFHHNSIPLNRSTQLRPFSNFCGGPLGPRRARRIV